MPVHQTVRAAPAAASRARTADAPSVVPKNTQPEAKISAGRVGDQRHHALAREP